MPTAEELAWENEGGRVCPASPEGGTETPQTSMTHEAATADPVPLLSSTSSTPPS